MKAIRIGTPIKAPGKPHMKLQKNTAKMTAKGEIANEAQGDNGETRLG